ncbi:MAG: FCD domain-containing protein, partial [Thauera sp.]|nr:FCD domain-containing protein [Thauera sp.]
LSRARYVIEGECAALAAKSARKAQVAAIEDSIDEMERERREGRQPLASDRVFHLRIAEATGNGALVQVVKLLWDERTGPLYQQLEH